MAWTDLDTSVWNMVGTAAVGALVACGPAIIVEAGTEGEVETEDDTRGPTSSPPPSTTASVTGPVPECTSDADCPAGYYCLEGVCYYNYCCEEGWYYECYSHQDCSGGTGYCENNYCNDAAYLADCGVPELSLEQITDLPAGEVIDLVYTEFDGDGVPDLAVLQDTGVAVQSSIDGLWSAFLVPMGTMQEIDSADVDNDNDDDLLFSYADNGSWSVATMTNDGMLGYVLATVHEADDEGTPGFIVGDFTGAGAIGFAYRRSQSVQVYSGDGARAFNHAWTIPTPAQELFAVDQNGDGYDDIAAFTGDFIAIAQGAEGSLQDWEYLDEQFSDVSRRVVAGDVTGDGVPDIIAARTGTSPTLIAQWDGATLGRYPYRTAVDIPFDMVYGDVEGDGRGEILVGTDSTVEIWSNTSPDEILGCASSVPIGHEARFIAYAVDPATGGPLIAAGTGSAVTVIRRAE